MYRVSRLGLARGVPEYVCADCRFVSTFSAASRWHKITSSTFPGSGSRVQVRGAKRKTTVKIKSTTPQGSLPAKPASKDEDGPEKDPEYSITIQQHKTHMQKHPDCVILTRMGNFYELYFEQAQEYSTLLGLKLAKKPTTRNKDGFVYMAGFPLHQLDRYLKVLVNDLGKHVAISQEIRLPENERHKNNGNQFDRKITRIVTPGTLIDEKFIDPWANNFLLAIHHESSNQHVGLAWVDLSCGDFFTEQTDLSRLASAITRIGPREILLDQQLDSNEASPLMDIIRQGQHSITYAQPAQLGSEAADGWTNSFDSLCLGAEANSFSQVEKFAGAMLVDYVQSTQLEQDGVSLQAPQHRSEDEYMMIDKHSLRALEITQTLRDNAFKGSLLQTIRETVTQSGARLLSQRLKAPSMSLAEINGRLDLVQGLIENSVLRDEVVALLRRASDSHRLMARFAFGRGEPDDLLLLAQTINVTTGIASVLQKHAGHDATTYLQQLHSRLNLDQPQALAKKIFDSIDEERLEQMHQIEYQRAGELYNLAQEQLEEAGEMQLKGAPQQLRQALAAPEVPSPADLWIMRRTASPRLTKLHNDLDSAFEEKTTLETKWRNKTGAKKLELRWIQPLGHVVHVKNVKNTNVDFSQFGKFTLARGGSTAKSFFHHDWTVLGSKIEDIKKTIRLEEERVFKALRKAIVQNIVKLRQNAAVLDELDVGCGFAALAIKKNWVRPILNNGTEHHIRGGRHPTVEAGLLEQGKQFTNNDCIIQGKSRILLITGPNMAGKSTFLRQNALISILAQIGSYVPAEYAEIGIVDKVFSRVGSADNLYQDQSTFMVEMLETAEILKQATPRSFVIMDEVGRGTTPEDGIAVGFAALSHLYHVNKSRALFATHFHVLADMTEDFKGLKCYCTDVAEDADGSFSYVHKLRQGVNRNPHALKVARLAGMPEEAIETASQVLDQLRNYGIGGLEQKSTPPMHEPMKISAAG